MRKQALFCFSCPMPSSFQVKDQAEKSPACDDKNKQFNLRSSDNYSSYDLCANENL